MHELILLSHTHCKILIKMLILIYGSTKVIDCYFKHEENEGKSKGLVELCKDLGVQLRSNIK